MSLVDVLTNSPAQADTNCTPDSSDAGSKRVNVVFSKDQYDKLQQLASRQNITLSDALRQAIGVADLVVNANANPNTQILLKTGNAVQELKLVR